jgi:hypothetical protein
VSFVLVVFLVTAIGIRQTASGSVLEMLQGNKSRAKTSERKKPSVSVQSVPQAVPHKTAIPSTVIWSEPQIISRKHLNYSFIFRHIIRQPLKTLLTAVAALLFVVALGWLQMTIEQTDREIEHLTNTLPITVEIMRQNYDTHVPMNNVISQGVVNFLLQNEFVIDHYLLAGYQWFNLIASDDNNQFDPTILEEIWETQTENWVREMLEWHFAVSCLHTFIDESRTNLTATTHEEGFEIWFAEGFGIDDFYYNTEDLDVPFPVIVHTEILERRGLNLGDIAFSTHNMSNLEHFHRPAVIIGAYSGSTSGGVMHQRDVPYVVLPMAALETLRGSNIGFITARLTIDPAKNAEVNHFISEITPRLNLNRINTAGPLGTVIPVSFPLAAAVFDEDFRMVIQPMEQNLALLRILYPVAIFTTFVLGLGLSLLLLMQNAKNAAIMRVLGGTRPKTIFTLLLGQVTVTIVGICLTFVVLPVIGGDLPMALPLGGLYLISAIIGSYIGATIITRNSPLELLQTKE